MSANSALSDRQVLLQAVLRGDWGAMNPLLDEINSEHLWERWQQPDIIDYHNSHIFTRMLLSECAVPVWEATPGFIQLRQVVDAYFQWRNSLRKIRNRSLTLADLEPRRAY